MIKFRERIKTWLAPTSFGIIDNRGEMYFVLADSFTVTKSGRLQFWRRGAMCAAVAEGEWKRVLKGIALDDMTED